MTVILMIVAKSILLFLALWLTALAISHLRLPVRDHSDEFVIPAFLWAAFYAASQVPL